MRKHRGRFIVLEGTDGSGKGVQFELLKKYLFLKKVRFETLDFPQYGKPSAYFVEQYLNGVYGSWEEVGPQAASLFYALDRFEVKRKVREWLRAGTFVLANRYVASNMGHQGAKFKRAPERARFIQWVHTIEYGILGVPKPDLNIFLSVPPRVAFKLIAQKKKRAYLKGGKKRDIHEGSLSHLERATEAYEHAMRLYPEDFSVLPCAPRGTMLSLAEIHSEILRLIKKYV